MSLKLGRANIKSLFSPTLMNATLLNKVCSNANIVVDIFNHGIDE